MIGWYQLFFLALIALRIASTEEERATLNVVLAATLASALLKHGFTIHTVSPEKLFVPAALEALTVAALLWLSPGKPAIRQSVCLTGAIAAHAACYLDIQLGTNLVYDGYETILALVAALQIACFFGTIGHNLLQIVTWFDSLLPSPTGASATLSRLLETVEPGSITSPAHKD